MIDISVIIPFYYGNGYINKLLCCINKNIVHLSGIAVEIIIMNDSPEIDVVISDCYAMNIKIFSNERNMGIHYSRVAGLKHASGTYIIWIDQDDVIPDTAILSQLTKIGNGDAVCGNAYIENKNGKLQLLYPNKLLHSSINCMCLYMLLGNRIVSPGQVMFRKSAIPQEWQNKILQNNGSDDFLLWLLFLNNNKRFICNEDVVYTHVYTGCNFSRDLDKLLISNNEIITILEKHNLICENMLARYKRRVKFLENVNQKRVKSYVRNIDILLLRILNKLLKFFP